MQSNIQYTHFRVKYTQLTSWQRRKVGYGKFFVNCSITTGIKFIKNLGHLWQLWCFCEQCSAVNMVSVFPLKWQYLIFVRWKLALQHSPLLHYITAEHVQYKNAIENKKKYIYVRMLMCCHVKSR